MSKTLGLIMLPMVQKSKGLYTWLVLKLDELSLESSLSVETAIRRTHGAFGAIAFGIGTSEVEHVFATQTIWQVKPKKMLVEFTGTPQKGIYSKDYILALIARYGVACGVGYVVEYRGGSN